MEKLCFRLPEKLNNCRTACIIVVALTTLVVCGAGYRKLSVPDIETAQNNIFRGFKTLESMDAYVVGENGERLGTIARSGTDALGNDFGAGSEFKADGLFNKFGKYGSEFSPTSAFNPTATKPPKILVEQGGDIYSVGVLTLNPVAETRGQRINPYILRAWLKK